DDRRQLNTPERPRLRRPWWLPISLEVVSSLHPVAVFALVLLASPARSLAQDARAWEETLTDALIDRNQPRLERMLADDFVLRSAPDVDRALWIRNAMTLCWGHRFDIDHFEQRKVGDVVIASFELTFYEDPMTCRPAILRSVITDVWVRHLLDEWQLQLRH